MFAVEKPMSSTPNNSTTLYFAHKSQCAPSSSYTAVCGSDEEGVEGGSWDSKPTYKSTLNTNTNSLVNNNGSREPACRNNYVAFSLVLLEILLLLIINIACLVKK